MDVNGKVAQAYSKLYFELKRKCESHPDADMLIAATALSRGEILQTTDKGFLKFDPLIKEVSNELEVSKHNPNVLPLR